MKPKKQMRRNWPRSLIQMSRYFANFLDSAIRIWHALSYIVWLLWQIILSSASVARVVMQPSRAHSGILAVHLDARTRLEIILLSTSVELTPGTLSIELGTDREGRRALFVHLLVLDNHDAAEVMIKHEFEERIFRFTRPTARRTAFEAQAEVQGIPMPAKRSR
jgi:multisubunit Na+/H+ antiporter MnhE subunit